MNVRRETNRLKAHSVRHKKDVEMILKLFKCQMCGHRFEAEVLDRENPKENHIVGSQLRCEKCNSAKIEPVRTLRRRAG